jgi:hypothetical protein
VVEKRSRIRAGTAQIRPVKIRKTNCIVA